MPLCMQLGTNLSGTPEEIPYLNDLKGGSAFNVAGGSGISANLQVDSNGYPTTMVLTDFTTATSITSFMFFGLPIAPGATGPYPSGTYVLLYDGAGTIALGGDATSPFFSTTGRQLYTIAAAGFLSVVINATDPLSVGNYIRNIRIVYSGPGVASTAGSGGGTVVGVNGVGTREALLNGGEIFNPDFIAKLKTFKAFRFMDWQLTLQSITQNWSDRTVPTFFSYTHAPADGTWPQSPSNSVGVPVEVMVALCNEVGCDGYFNMPYQASDDYITQFATLVLNGGGGFSGLNSNLKAYEEYGNEIWNFAYSQSSQAYMQAQASIYFPTGGNIFSFAIMRMINASDLWSAVWSGGNSNRLVRLGSGQCGFEVGRNDVIRGWTVGVEGSTQIGLGPHYWTGAAGTHWDAFVTAPYFGYSVPVAWTADADIGLTKLFTEMNIGGLIPVFGGTSVTSTGIPSAYTVTTGQSLPATPPNQTLPPIIIFDIQSGVTISLANPCVVTWTGSNMQPGTPVRFSTTGALPSHITSGAEYFVLVAGLGPDSFQISTSSNGYGTPISTLGDTQSGTQTIQSSNGAQPTLQADGGNALTLTNYDGSPIEAGALGFAAENVICLTSAIAPTVNMGLFGVTQSVQSTVTISIAAPAVITWAVGAPTSGIIIFSTTGALPTGVIAGISYYVQSLSSTTFNISATPNGIAIATTGSQSGVHTCFTATVLSINSPPSSAVSTLVSGATAAMSSVSGMTQLNGNSYSVLSYNNSGKVFLNVNSSSFSAYTGGGIVNFNGGLSTARWWLTDTFGYLTGMIQQFVDAFNVNYAGAQNPYGLQLVGYESGQNLVSGGNPPLALLFLIANRDSRMSAAYTKYLAGIQAANHNNLINHFNDMEQPTDFGTWGALESIMEPTSAKQNALLDALMCSSGTISLSVHQANRGQIHYQTDWIATR